MKYGDKVRYIRNGEVFVGAIISESLSVRGIIRYETTKGHWITPEELE